MPSVFDRRTPGAAAVRCDGVEPATQRRVSEQCENHLLDGACQTKRELLVARLEGDTELLSLLAQSLELMKVHDETEL